MRAEDCRRALLDTCRRHYEARLAYHGPEGRQVRHGLLRAEQVINECALQESAVRWLDEVIAALGEARRKLEDADDEDGWASGAIGTILASAHESRRLAGKG